MELRLQKRLPFGHPPQVTTLSLSGTVLTKNELCETVYGFSQCKICKQDTPQYVLGFSGNSFLPQMAFTCLLTWAFRQVLYGNRHGTSSPFTPLCSHSRGFPGGASGKEPTSQCRSYKRCRFDPWVRKIPWREGMATNSSVLAWRIPMDRGAWQATVHRVTKRWAWLKRLSTQAQFHSEKPFGMLECKGAVRVTGLKWTHTHTHICFFPPNHWTYEIYLLAWLFQLLKPGFRSKDGETLKSPSTVANVMVS